MARGETISVVIPTYNRREFLEKNLRAIAAQTFPAEKTEAIVVCDGGTDDTEEMVRSFAAPFRLKFIRIEHWTDIPYNVGARAAENDFILFLDDDVIPHPGLLAAHAASHNRFEGPTAVIGRLQWPDEKKLTPFEEYVGKSGMLMGTHLIEDPDNAHFRFALGGNFSVPRRLFHDAGGYDTAYLQGGYGHGDVEFGYTLQKRFGARLVYNSEASADHWCCSPFPRFLEQRGLAGATAVIFYTKHPELARYLKIDWVRRRGPWAWAVNNCLHSAYHAVRPLVPSMERLYPLSRPALFFSYRLCIFYNFQRGIREYLKKVEEHGANPFPRAW